MKVVNMVEVVTATVEAVKEEAVVQGKGEMKVVSERVKTTANMMEVMVMGAEANVAVVVQRGLAAMATGAEAMAMVEVVMATAEVVMR